MNRKFGMIALMLVALLGGAVSTTVRAQLNQSNPPPLALASLTGRDSFDRYCSACHGRSGRGDGPAAAALKTPPPDLTTLTQRHGATFPRQQLVTYIEGTARTTPTHGTSDMPVWGPAFRGLESNDARVRTRIDNLVSYIESIQEEPSSPAPQTMSGAQLFRTYCASCHGQNAQGAGPVSPALHPIVPDLTTFSVRNGGVFPSERVRQIIEGRGPAVHGDRTMPLWGDVFTRQSDAGDTAADRIDRLVTFLQSIQRLKGE